MSWWRRSGGRHAREAWSGRAASPPARLTVEPARISGPPPPPAEHGLVRLVFQDGSAVALDAHDPRSRAFRALADGMLERQPGTAQGRTRGADPHQEWDGGAAPSGGVPGERGLG